MTSPAGFWIRFLAVIIDTILFSLLKWALGFVFTLVGLTREPTEAERQLLEELGKKGDVPAILEASLKIAGDGGAYVSGGIFFVISLLLVFYFTMKKGGTPGKLALGLRIQQQHGEELPNFWRTFLREIVGKYFLWPLTLGVGAIALAFNEKKRGLHDVVGGTCVVKVSEP